MIFSILCVFPSNIYSSSRRTQVLFFVFIFYTSIVVAFCSLWYITVCGMWLHGVHSNSTVFQDIILIWVSFQSSIMHPLYHQHSSRRIPPHSEKTSQSTPTFFWPHTWRMHTSIDPQNFRKIVCSEVCAIALNVPAGPPPEVCTCTILFLQVAFFAKMWPLLQPKPKPKQ